MKERVISICAIFGSFNRSLFDILHDANQKRGEFSTSLVGVSKDNKIRIKRQEGIMRYYDKQFPEVAEELVFLGHCQAPTSAQRKYDKSTSHPFKYGKWMVAHNGVLTNYKDLNAQYTPFNKNPVDTSTIAAMLASFKNDNETIDNCTIIQKVLDLLEGTFALWIINIDNPQKVYLVRQGSTLFANETGSFSSIQGNGWNELAEGTIYLMENNLIKEVGKFKNTTPFLVL